MCYLDKMLFAVICVIYQLYIVSGQDSCTSPDGTPGSCISITRCKSVIALLRQRIDGKLPAANLAMLRRYHCGFEEVIPKVCCTDSMMEEVTRPPTTNRTTSSPNRHTSTMTPSTSSNCQMTDQLPVAGCCGVEEPNDRIVGGDKTTFEQFPWLAIIEYEQRRGDPNASSSTKKSIYPLCVGSLITGKHVVTAAHCVEGAILGIASPKSIRLGDYDITEDMDCMGVGADVECTNPTVSISIASITVHPQYLGTSINAYDIALIKMTIAAPYTDFIRPICLPTMDVTANPEKDLTFQVAGWGATDKYTSKSNVKLFVRIPYFDKEKCREIFYAHAKVNLTDSQMCAGGELGKDSCKGDSGGPLMYNRASTFELTGVVSFGSNPCAQADTPGVYSHVFLFRDWILANM